MKNTGAKRLLVTGGASGIGASIARLAAERGHQVMIADIDADGAEAVAREIGDAARSTVLDIRSSEQWESAIAECSEKMGGLDVLINNAGIVHTGLARNVTLAAHQLTFDVNTMGPIRGMLAALPFFRAQGSGQFVTVCSMTSFLPFPGLASYAASKHALRAFHHALALEERETPLSFTIVHPTSTETPMLQQEAQSDEAPMAFLSEAVTPDYVADVVLTAMRKKTVEVFMPPEQASSVRSLGTNPRRLRKVIALAEAAGRRNLDARRASEDQGASDEAAVAAVSR